MDDGLTLSGIKNLNKEEALELFNKVGLRVPEEADLDFLRSNLRLFLLGGSIAEYRKRVAGLVANTSGDTKSSSAHEYENEEEEDSSSIYEDVDLGADRRMAVPRESHPFFNPGNFSGNVRESIEVFLKKFERAAKVNNWGEDKMKLYLPIYLSDTALVIFENLEKKEPDIDWQGIKREFGRVFSPVESRELMVAQLNTRVQLSTETVVQYATDVERLCTYVDPDMEEGKVCGHIIKGLDPAILQQISMLDNSTVPKLRDNIAKCQMASYLMRQRLGLGGICLPQGAGSSGVQQQLQELTHMVQQLQVSMKNGGRKEDDSNNFSRGRSLGNEWERGRSPARKFNSAWSRESSFGDGFRKGSQERGGFGSNVRGRSPEQRRDFENGQRYRERSDSRGSFNFDRKGYEERRSKNVWFPNNVIRGTNDRKCWKCGKLGHISRNCYAKVQKN